MLSFTPTPTAPATLDGKPVGTVIDPASVTAGDVRWFRQGTPGQLSVRSMRGATRVQVVSVAADLVALAPAE